MSSEPSDQLGEEEYEAWGGFLRMHTVIYRELDRRLVRGQSLPLSSYDVLLRLGYAGADGLRMSDLAEQVFLTSGGLTRLAERLERDDLIVRTPNPEDRRGYHARLTPKGRAVLKRARRQHLEDVRELFVGHLTKAELKTFARVWRRLKRVTDDPSIESSEATRTRGRTDPVT